MNALSQWKLNKAQKYVVFAVTIGNILEWYDIYLYVFWSKTIAGLFFDSLSSGLLNVVAFFAISFVFRPLGGIFFGRLGDLIGRKKSFILSILLMTIPTFVFGLIPVYSQIGIFAPILLAICRILQTFPAGGELPGVFCYLYENADPKNRKFMTSFAGVGNQLGIALSATECYLVEKFLPSEFLLNYGWRISFIVGGLIGLIGFYLRYKLHETVLFQEMVIHHQMTHRSILGVIKDYWKKICAGMCYGAAQTVSFHFISIIFPLYFYRMFDFDSSQDLIATIALLLLTTIPLPIFGLLGDKFGIKKLATGACIGMLCLVYPLYNYGLEHLLSCGWVIIVGFILCLTCITALWPYLLSNLFPTPVRYTCVGLSFNIADGVFGGITTLLAVYLLNATGNPESSVWILVIACAISLTSFIAMKSDVKV